MVYFDAKEQMRFRRGQGHLDGVPGGTGGNKGGWGCGGEGGGAEGGLSLGMNVRRLLCSQFSRHVPIFVSLRTRCVQARRVHEQRICRRDYKAMTIRTITLMSRDSMLMIYRLPSLQGWLMLDSNKSPHNNASSYHRYSCTTLQLYNCTMYKYN